MLFDTHAHYDADAFDGDRLELLAALPHQGVSYVLNPGCDLPSSQTAVQLAEQFPHVYAAVGVHPSDCESYTDAVEGEFLKLAQHPKVRAIGEIGLDYYWEDNAPREVQQQVFHRQLDLAEKLNLPVIVHDREAHGDCLDIVKSHPKVTGVYHCYSGGVEDAKTLVKLGWMLSFTGVITYKNARKSLEVIQAIPMEHIMIETDSPYLSPVPFRGKRNDASHVHLVAEKIAEIKQLSFDQVAEITTQNALRFFSIHSG